jgi:hypothetical protein
MPMKLSVQFRAAAKMNNVWLLETARDSALAMGQAGSLRPVQYPQCQLNQ